MSQVVTKRRKKTHPPPKLDRGQHAILAAHVEKPPATIRKHYTQHKYDKWIKNGKYDLDAIKENLPKILNRKYQQNREKQHQQKPTPKQIPTPTNEDDVKSYLDETMGELSLLDLNELQRRNELEKLLMARIKRNEVESATIPIESAKKTLEQILSTTINQLESLSVKASPLLAVEGDSFECKQIIDKEIDFIRRQIISDLKTVQGGEYVR